MYLVHEHGEVCAETVKNEIETPISYSGARRYLSILEEKGFLTMENRGNKYFYKPVANTTEVGLKFMKKIFGSFFAGSPTLGIATFMQKEGGKLDDQELASLEKLLQDVSSEDDQA